MLLFAALCGYVTNIILIFFIINGLSHVGRMKCLLSYINRTFHCKSDKIFISWNIFSYFGKLVSHFRHEDAKT
jgi:hypothetical protein